MMKRKKLIIAVLVAVMMVTVVTAVSVEVVIVQDVKQELNFLHWRINANESAQMLIIDGTEEGKKIEHLRYLEDAQGNYIKQALTSEGWLQYFKNPGFKLHSEFNHYVLSENITYHMVEPYIPYGYPGFVFDLFELIPEEDFQPKLQSKELEETLLELQGMGYDRVMKMTFSYRYDTEEMIWVVDNNNIYAIYNGNVYKVAARYRD